MLPAPPVCCFSLSAGYTFSSFPGPFFFYSGQQDPAEPGPDSKTPLFSRISVPGLSGAFHEALPGFFSVAVPSRFSSMLGAM
ncbi:MAG TPA: hypothetical protein DCM58_01275 [Desulfovibrio sp.]|nr:hypothetical protein [Desulfovibrio sp.]